jgi:mono/diheme cytochrome c family protein
MRRRGVACGGAWAVIALLSGGAPDRDRDAIERGRISLTADCFLPPGWSLDAYKKAGALWDEPAPDPGADPTGYDAAFRRRYGLHPAPYPNDGLPMGLRRTTSRDGARVGIQLDCMVCHGGSIGGTSYVGLGNSQLDLKALLDDLTRADGRLPPFSLFTVNSSRGTNNAGQIAVALLSLRNPDLSFRAFPLLTGASLPELDTPPWWILGKKATKYYDGRTDARAYRSNMQFLLGDASLERLKELEPAYRDIDAYLKSLTPPKYPFPIDPAKQESGRLVFEANCTKCHGTYGPEGHYPNKIVPIEIVGTDPARLRGLTDRFIDHYNATWLGEDFPVEAPPTGYQAPPLDGIWASAPYLHNGSVPTLYHLLKSSERPSRFRRPPSTDYAYYDRERVGWTFEVVAERPSPGLPPHEAKWIFDAARWGLGNGGHPFGDKLSDDERSDLIEYLKTL